LLFLLFAAVVAIALSEKVVTIVETDAGQYMDDTWALATLLADDRLDVRMIVLSTNDTISRAKIVAKLIKDSEYASRNITLLIGTKNSDYAGPQSIWAQDFDLSTYPGTILSDVDSTKVVSSLIKNALMDYNATGRVMLVELAPPVVFGSVAEQYGDVFFSTGRVFVSMMGGSFFYTYGHRPGQGLEYNTRFNVSASKRFFNGPHASTAADHFILSPLDTSCQVRIENELWQRFLQVYEKRSSFLMHVVESFRVWKENCPLDPLGIMCSEGDPAINSGILFDAEAAAFASSMIRTLDGDKEDPFFSCVNNTVLRMYIDDVGYTKIDNDSSVSYAHERTAALSWLDHDRFIELLTARILKEN